MGARGPHDDFETAAQVIRAGYASFSVDQDIDELCRKYVSDDLEWVTRDGILHGIEPFLERTRVQLERWRMEFEVEDVIDAGEGAVIAMTKVKRLEKGTGEVAWKAWPAVVMRVHGGKMVFNEGYVDRRKALDDLGVEQS
jgi:ketosteroid isomerase-like protein